MSTNVLEIIDVLIKYIFIGTNMGPISYGVMSSSIEIGDRAKTAEFSPKGY